MSRSRRTLLAALGISLAGCSADPPSTTTETPPPAASETPVQPPTGSPAGTPDPSPERVALDDDRVPWRIDHGGDRLADIAAEDGRLYAGVTDEPTPTPQAGETAGTGRLIGLSLPDGEPVLNRSQSAPVSDGPWLHNGAVYAVLGYSNGYAGVSQRLVRFDRDGDRQWQSSNRDAWLSIYDFDADTAYLGTGDDAVSPTGERVFAVDLKTGEGRWEADGGDAGLGRVDGETLYAGYAGLALAALDTADGTERWQRAVQPLHSRDQWFPNADGRLFARIEGDTDAFAALDQTDGSVVWERPDTAAMSATPVERLVVGTDYEGTVFALDAETGNQRWSRQFSGRPETPLVADDRLVVAFSEGPLVSLDPATGETGWRVDSWAGRYVYHLSTNGGALLSVASGQEEAVVTARPLDSGERRWQRRLSGRSRDVLRADGLLALATDDSVYGVVLD